MADVGELITRWAMIIGGVGVIVGGVAALAWLLVQPRVGKALVEHATTCPVAAKVRELEADQTRFRGDVLERMEEIALQLKQLAVAVACVETVLKERGK